MNRDLLFDEAITAAMRGDTDKAIENFCRVVQLDPDYVPALYHLGKAYLKKGDFAAAIDTLKLAATKRPHQASIHVDLGQAHLCRNELDKARNAFTKALALEDGSVRAITGIAQVYLKSEEWERAASHAKLVLLNNPMNFAALYILGAAGRSTGDITASGEALQKARDIVNQFLNLKPEQVEGHFLLGETYFYEGILDKAMENYQLADKQAGDALNFVAFGLTFTLTDLQSKLGLCYKRLGLTDKAQKIGERILEREPDNKVGRELMPEKPD